MIQDDDFDGMPTPYAPEAECSVIGALLLDNAAFDRMTVSLEPSDFYHAENSRVFGAVRQLISENKPADAVTVYAALGGSDTALLAFLGDAANNTPGASGINRYAEIVKEKALERSILAASASVSEKACDRSMTAAEKLDFAQAQFMALSDTRSADEPELVGDLLHSLIDDIEAAEEGRLPKKSSCGLADVDARIDICSETDMVVIGGRPGMGKTTFGLNVGLNRARNGESGLVWSGEMPKSQIRNKFISSIGRIEYKALREKRKLTNDEYERLKYAIGVMQDLPVAVFDTPGISVYELASKARKMKRVMGGLSWIVVDYLQLMRGDGKEPVQQITSISKGLKMLAKSLNVTVYALAQLNRSLEQRPNKRPVMADLRESGAIEQDADSILFVYRDEIYNPDSEAKGMAELIVGKNRHGDSGGMIPLVTELQYSLFQNAVQGSYPDLGRPRKQERSTFSKRCEGD